MKKKLLSLMDGQGVWLFTAVSMIALFSYYQYSGHRLFGEAETEKWSPQGASNHSQIHHK